MNRWSHWLVYLDMLLQVGAAWIGYNDIQREQEFVNSDETLTNFTSWAIGMPEI